MSQFRKGDRVIAMCLLTVSMWELKAGCKFFATPPMEGASLIPLLKSRLSHRLVPPIDCGINDALRRLTLGHQEPCSSLPGTLDAHSLAKH